MAPKVSVVTINRNMVGQLSRTIESVLCQSHPEMEFVIIDGASTDGSQDVVRKYSDRIAYWISEPDAGIYDAMNKGVQAATGDWIIFMNSGDNFLDADVVRDMFSVDVSDCDLVYGHAVWRQAGIDTIWVAEPLDVLPFRMNCSHQSLFARRELMLRHPFERNLLVSDYAFLVKAWRNGARFKSRDRIVSVATAGGLSDRRRFRSLWQRTQILRRHGLMTPALATRYAGMLLLQPAMGFVKSLLPARLRGVILRMHAKGHKRG